MSERKGLSDAAATELSNRLAGEIAAHILDGPLAAGGSLADVLVLCEIILTNVIVECCKQGANPSAAGAPEAILDALAERVSQRLRDIPLNGIARN